MIELTQTKGDSQNDLMNTEDQKQEFTCSDDHLIARDANGIIMLARKKCIERGELEPGIKRGRCHVILENSDKCICEAVDLTKYRVSGQGKRE